MIDVLTAPASAPNWVVAASMLSMALGGYLCGAIPAAFHKSALQRKNDALTATSNYQIEAIKEAAKDSNAAYNALAHARTTIIALDRDYAALLSRNIRLAAKAVRWDTWQAKVLAGQAKGRAVIAAKRAAKAAAAPVLH